MKRMIPSLSAGRLPALHALHIDKENLCRSQTNLRRPQIDLRRAPNRSSVESALADHDGLEPYHDNRISARAEARGSQLVGIAHPTSLPVPRPRSD